LEAFGERVVKTVKFVRSSKIREIGVCGSGSGKNGGGGGVHQEKPRSCVVGAEVDLG